MLRKENGGIPLAIFDVPAAELIEAVAADLKKRVKQPEWIEFVKSGRHRERAPHRRDWFFVRMASILYRAYKDGGVGTNRLRTYYGGRKNRGVKPHRFFRASGKVIRLCLQELEKQGFLSKGRRGRVVSGSGESYLHAKALEVKKRVEEKAKRVPAEAKAVEKQAMEKNGPEGAEGKEAKANGSATKGKAVEKREPEPAKGEAGPKRGGNQ
jgi:small subunit ribosomal protein S19e